MELDDIKNDPIYKLENLVTTISISTFIEEEQRLTNLKKEEFEQSLRESTERTTNSGSALFGANKNIFQSSN